VSSYPKKKLFFEDMDLDVNIEDIEFLDEEHGIQERREITTELDT
jgi:hypothetical protein